jgi:DNA-binding response OmpR family regulator
MALAREPNRAFTRPQLVQAAFGDDFEGVERNVDVHIMKLRRKLSFGADGPIKAVFGVGYKYETT